MLTFKNQIKPKDIGGLGVELNDRKGSGNYDKERTQFNIEYVGFDGHPTLSSKVYETIYTNNIHFNKGDNTNILNGCVVTSGPEFFRKLGLPMKDTGIVHVEGKHIGEPIFCPNIKSKEDIPEQVLEYFNESYRFLSNIVGKENVVYAGVHFDEDTPHMHFYFLPVVDHVRRKVFKTDEFWKQLGGKASFARLQDQYNEYITSKGFELDRGKIGANKHHQDKDEHNIKVLEDKIDKLNKELEMNKRINEVELKTNKEIKNINEEELLNPSKDIFKKYKDKDAEKLIDYSKEIKKENIMSKNELEKKELKIEKLENQISQFKSGKTYSDKEKVIANQERIINEQKGIIEGLTEEVQSLKAKLNRLLNVFHEKLNSAYLAIAHLLGFKNVNKDNVNHDLMDYKVQDINRKHEPRYNKSTKDKSDDYEL